jgi:cyclophilin family peptidyl-prolyl cis-trans isomerase
VCFWALELKEYESDSPNIYVMVHITQHMKLKEGSNVRRPTKERLVAYNGKLVTVQEQQGAVPNGSGFVITTAAQPAFDVTNLVVGKVVSGMDVVEQIAKMPAVRANTGSPFFK